MASAVYSTQVFNAEFPIGVTEAYTVPEGYVLVLRDVSALNRTEEANAVEISVSGHGGPGVNLPGGGAGSWSGRVVCNPGDVLYVLSSQEVAVICSGYLLSSP